MRFEVDEEEDTPLILKGSKVSKKESSNFCTFILIFLLFSTFISLYIIKNGNKLKRHTR